MSKNRRAASLLAVDLTAGRVTFTMDPQMAHAVAQSLTLGLINHDEWRDDIVTMLTAAADREGIFSRTMPTIPRDEFVRGNWNPRADEHEQAAEPRPSTSQLLREMEGIHATDQILIDASRPIDTATGGLDVTPTVLDDCLLDAVSPQAAVAVVAAAVAITTDAQTALAVELEAAAAHAAVVARDAVAAAAERTAEAAETARQANALAVAMAADAAAETASQTALAIQHQAEESAATVADAAANAMDILISNGDAAPDVIAARLAASVSAAAIATAEVTAVAAAMVARAVAAAATEAATAATAAAAIVEHEVSMAAVDVQAVANTTARELAAETAAKAIGVALATR
jgi:hypothetical protein